MGNSMHLRVSPYGRISDSEEERAPGIDRQLRIVYPLIKRNGGTPTREYIDNDKSAFKVGVVRDEGFEPWLQDFIDNKTDGVAAFDLDRLWRQPMDLERVIRAYCHAYFMEGRPKPVLWLPSMSIDLTDEDGQFIARTLCNVANQASGKTVKRVQSFYLDEAKKGKVYNVRAPMGRNKDDSINEAEAELLRWAKNEAFAGIPPTRMAEELRARGFTTKNGGRITGNGLRKMLLNPANAGIAVYKGKPLRDESGNYILRQCEPIWSIEEHELLTETLSSRGVGRKPAKSLCGGIAVCGRCGYGMVRMPRKNGRYSYNCRSKDSGGCASVSINGNRLDAMITELITRLLKDQEVEQSNDVPGAARLAEIAQQRQAALDMWASKQISDGDFLAMKDKLDEERKTLQVQVNQVRRRKRATLNVAEEFPNLPVLKQRAIIKTFIKAIVIAPAKDNYSYDPSRISIVYAD